jgi:hypothetical protein
MTRLTAGSLALMLAACSDFTTTDGGIAQIIVATPVPAELEVEQSVTMRAAAIDENGDTLDIPIYWRALDTTLIVDSVAGLVTGRTAGQTGRVVARAVDLYSNVITFSILRQADSVIRVSDSSVTVAAGTAESPELVGRVEAGDPPEPVQGRRMTYEVVQPVFSSPEDRTVEFAGGLLAISPRSGAQGTPEQPVTLHRRAGRTQPDTAIVEVAVYRPDGSTVAGSGFRFYVLFN